MTLPLYPPSPHPRPDPGPIPLRPLGVGDLIGAGFGVMRRNLATLGLVSVLVAAVSSAATFGILAGAGTLHSYAEGSWLSAMLEDLAAGKSTSLPTSYLVAGAVGLVISITGAILLSGLAAAYAGLDALGRPATAAAVQDRLRGSSLLLVSVCVAFMVSAGLALLIVPGVIVFTIVAVAAPITVMERAGLATALRRSARLTAGSRARIFGVTALSIVIGTGIDIVVGSVVVAASRSLSPLTALLVSQGVSALVAAVTTTWTGAVIALLYIDLRIRREGLAQALHQTAAADRAAGRARLGPATG